ncbi:MAG: galactonate dehydratase [Luteitalea sp.]|nr:galactonate dehydratase [Luteitalea sp.]
MSLSRRKAIAGIFAATGIAVTTDEQLVRAQQTLKTAPVPTNDPLKVTRLETFLVKPRWLFLKIHTNAGLVGLGEPVTEGRALTCATAVKEIEPYLVGKDPRAVQQHWQAIYRHAFYRGGPILTSALSGIDQALWDVKGKALGIPVYEFFGGPTRHRIRVYAHSGPLERMKESLQQGFTAFKTGPASSRRGPSGRVWSRYVETPAEVDYTVERFAEMRKAVGDNVDIGIDFHGRISPALAKILIKKLEPYNPMFIEEPCQAQNHDVMAEIARGTHLPIATGERVFTKWGFREVLENKAATILQPDLCHAGGISEVRIIAGMAEAYYASIAPHNPLGPISLASGVQLAASINNFLIQEQVSLGEGYLTKPFTVRKGYLDLPPGPGLGIELDENAMADKIGHDWRNPESYDEEDGSVVDW